MGAGKPEQPEGAAVQDPTPRPTPDFVLEGPARQEIAAPRRLATDAERRALASVLRLRILRMCLYEPLTNKEIAARLGRNPASVLHHVRTLASQGFLVAGAERRGPRGSREVPYSATGKSWTLDSGRDGDNTVLRAFLEEVAQVPESDVASMRMGLQLTDAHYQELLARISALFDEYARRPFDAEGSRHSMFLAIHPEP